MMSIAGTLTLTAAGGGGRYTATNSLTTVSGTVINDGTAGITPGLITSSAANLTFASGGNYLHAVDGGAVPGATWSAGSTCTVNGIVTIACTGVGQDFYNLIWNCPAQTVSVGMSAGSQIIAGQLDVQNTNSGSLIFCTELSATAAATLTIGGNFNLSGGTFSMSVPACTRPVNLKLLGNLTLSGGIFTKDGILLHNVNFNGSVTQNFSKSGGTITNDINFRVLNGSTLNMGTNILDGSTSTFNLLAGGGIITSDPQGLALSGATGSIQVGGTRTYNNGGNYLYNGTSVQETGSGLVGANNLTIDNSAGVSLTNTTTIVNGILTINSGKLLLVNPLKRLTVNGIITNNAGTAGLVIKSDASGSGSIIESSGADATVESYISGNRWHFISAPVSGAVSGMFTGKYLQNFTESTNAYADITSTTEPLTPMKGFALWGDAAGFITSYTGPLNTGAISIGLTRTSTGFNSGWNLVGNPYASSIDWDAATGWTKTNLNGPIYIERAGGWATYTTGAGTNGGTKFIAPGQGFFVNVGTVGTGTLGMNNSVRLHRNTTFFKNTNADNLARFEVSGNGYTDEAVVRFMPEATAEFDGQYDAYKLFGYVDESAQIYTLGSEPMTINSLLPETSEVPLGIHAATSGSYTIAATELVDVPVVTLEDTKTGIFTDLVAGSYTFNFETGENEVRFMLHFGTTGISDPEKAVNTTIYSYKQTIFIDLKDQSKGDIFIYNAAGQLVSTQKASQGMNEVKLQNTGIYMVKVITAKSTIVKKAWIE